MWNKAPGAPLNTRQVHVFFLVFPLFLGYKAALLRPAVCCENEAVEILKCWEARNDSEAFYKIQAASQRVEELPKAQHLKAMSPRSRLPPGCPPTAGRAWAMRVGEVKNMIEIHPWQNSTECIYVPALPSLSKAHIFAKPERQWSVFTCLLAKINLNHFSRWAYSQEN